MNRRIVHVPRRFTAQDWGGTETVILETARRQQAEGADPVILTSMALAAEKSEVIGGIPVKRFRHVYPFFGLSAADKAALDLKGGNLLSLPLFYGLWREPDVRLFHAHTLKRLGGTVRTVARLRKKPYVVSLHGGVFDVPAAERGDLARPVEGKFEWGRPFGALLGARRVLQEADHVICVGQSEAEKAAAELNHGRVSYLPNGVDSARFTQGDGAGFRRENGIPENAFLLLAMGRIDAQKNQLGLLEAFLKFHAKVPEARLLILGPVTQPAYAEKLHEFIRANHLTDSARILPGLPNHSPALVDAFHAADVFVLASRHEPFGIVVLEAWCAGCAAVVSRVGGLRALVRENETGLMFDPGAADAADQLAACLFRLHADPAARRALGEAGKAEALAHYDWSRISARLENVYRQAEENCRSRLK
ncbi:MAG: glycosyltransferase family 4 protein [Verrucomicrobiota bacterium]